MAKESKVQAVAKKKAAGGSGSNPHVVGQCPCGGEIVWVKVVGKGMRKMCLTCALVAK